MRRTSAAGRPLSTIPRVGRTSSENGAAVAPGLLELEVAVRADDRGCACRPPRARCRRAPAGRPRRRSAGRRAPPPGRSARRRSPAGATARRRDGTGPPRRRAAAPGLRQAELEVGNDRVQPGADGAQRLEDLRALAAGGDRPHQLDPVPVGASGLGAGAHAPHRRDAALLGERRELAGQCRLPDARLARQGGHAAHAGGGVVEQRHEILGLQQPADDRAAGPRPARRRRCGCGHREAVVEPRADRAATQRLRRGLGQLAGALGAVVGRLGQRRRDHLVHRGRQPYAEVRHRGDRRLQVRVEHGRHRGVGERHRAR